jgi:hypothetical protein
MDNYRIAFDQMYNLTSLFYEITFNIDKLNHILNAHHQNMNPTAVYSLGKVYLVYGPYGPELTYPTLKYKAVYQLHPVGPYMPVSLILGNLNLIYRLIQPRQLTVASAAVAVAKRASAYFKELTIETTIEANTDDAQECPVCLDVQLDSQNVVYTNCGHGYCVVCVKTLVTTLKDTTKEPPCPLCRTTLSKLTTGTDATCVEIKHHIDCL